MKSTSLRASRKIEDKKKQSLIFLPYIFLSIGRTATRTTSGA